MSNWQNLDFIASRIQKKLEGGIVTDDSRIQLSIIKDEIHKARADYIKSMMKGFWQPPTQYYQTISCIPVECKEIVCNNIGSGVFEYVANVPSLIGSWGIKSLKNVTSIDKKILFACRTAKFTLPYTKPSASYQIESDKIVLNFECIDPFKFIRIEGLFSDPYAAIEQSECSDWNVNYPMPADDLGSIEDIVFKRMSPQKQIRHDTKNDAQPT